jgi:hypothetical protein
VEEPKITDFEVDPTTTVEMIAIGVVELPNAKNLDC